MATNTKTSAKSQQDAKDDAAQKNAAATTANKSESLPDDQLTSNDNTSAITSDAKPEAGDREIDLSKARIILPGEGEPKEEEPAPEAEPDNSFIGRANAAGIGKIKVDGYGFEYVGVSPLRDKDPITPEGNVINGSNSTFTPLSEVVFDRSMRVRDPQTGEFYYPQKEATSWESTSYKGSPLVPAAE